MRDPYRGHGRTARDGAMSGRETLRFHCTTCPSECGLVVEIERDPEGFSHPLSISGNRCDRGRSFAMQEVVRPMRVFTTTVAVQDGDELLLPVRTSSAIPRDLHAEAMDVARNATVNAPVTMGDVIVKDLLGTGADLIASMDVDVVAQAHREQPLPDGRRPKQNPEAQL